MCVWGGWEGVTEYYHETSDNAFKETSLIIPVIMWHTVDDLDIGCIIMSFVQLISSCQLCFKGDHLKDLLHKVLPERQVSSDINRVPQ